MNKTCTKCLKEFPEEAFYFGVAVQRRRTRCRPCESAASYIRRQKRMQRDPESFMAHKRRYEAMARSRRREARIAQGRPVMRRLTAAEVLEIRSLVVVNGRSYPSGHPKTIGAIAKRYGVTPKAIYAIRSRQSWKHL